MPSRSRLPEWPKAGEQLEAVEQAGGDSARFSGISAFKGGIYRDVAIEAHVDEAILYLQSGHSPDGRRQRPQQIGNR